MFKSNIHDSLKNIEQHIGKQALKTFQENAEKMNQIDVATDIEESNESIRVRSIRVAETIKSRGWKIGDVILLCGVNHSDFCLPFLASLYIGTATLSLASGMTYGEIKHIANIAKPKIAFVDSDMAQIVYDVFHELGTDVEIVVFGEKYKTFSQFSEFLKPTYSENTFQCENFDPNTTPAFLICSSGTTGLPKVIAKYHSEVIMGFLFMFLNDDKKYKTFLNFSPLCWLSGVMTLLASFIFGITRLHSSKTFTPELIEKAINKYKPDMMLCNPVIICTIIRAPNVNQIDFSCLKEILWGGGGLEEQLINEFQNLITNGIVSVLYGTTETGILTYNNGFKNSSLGNVLPWVQWKITNPDTEEKMKPNMLGELRVKSETTMKNYYNNSEYSSLFDNENFYKTGDLCYYDEENNIYYKDRIKEMIKYRNFPISVSELENAILKLPEVVSVGVIGLPHIEDGDHPMAFVQLTKGAKLSDQIIINLIKDNFSDSKQLRGGVVFMDKIPLTPSAKVDRKALKKLGTTYSK